MAMNVEQDSANTAPGPRFPTGAVSGGRGHRSDWWIDNLVRPAIIAAMLACLIAPLVQFIQWLYTGWDGTYVLFFYFFAGLEGILSERALQKRGINGYGYLISRGAELVILLILLKLASYIPLGFEQFWADALLWSSDLNLFLTDADLLLGFLFIPMWASALYVGRVVRELDVEERDPGPPPDKTSTDYYMWLTRPKSLRDRQRVLGWLGEMFVWGGIVMLLASTAIHFFVSSVWTLLIPTMLYFVLGIALLSQGRFSILHASWQVQEVPVQRGIGRRWLLWTLLFFLGVSIVALLLPRQPFMGPVQALVGLLLLLINLISQILFLLFLLLLLPLSLLFPNIERPERPDLPVAPILPPAETMTGGGSPPWLQILVSILFWVVVLAIVGYALVRFLRDRIGSVPEAERARVWWGRLLAWLQSLWQRWWTWSREVQARREQRRAARQEDRQARAGRRRFFFPGRLPPRELIRYFYLSVAGRAAQAGRSRRPGETPYEYQRSLDERFDDLEPDLTGLTDAFVTARYSPHPLAKEDAEGVKPLWQRVRAALRRRTRFGQQPNGKEPK
jgi:hypothetical protein